MISEPLHIIALSGGKDSTAMALRLAEIDDETEFTYVCTPTGDELPEMEAHWCELERLLGKPLVYLRHEFDLNGLINHMNGLPSWRMRWCTRILKIEVAQAFYLKYPGSTAYVGLRADEESRIGGIYGEIVTQRYPLREWGWGINEVLGYLDEAGVKIPKRTDCARCYDQRLGEWWELWKSHPDIYDHAAAQEAKYGHTFRSPGRDTWPAALVDLRTEFEAGRLPRDARVNGELFPMEQKCRVCSL